MVVAAAAVLSEGAAVAAAKKGKLWVCGACAGFYFAPVNDLCPGCKGAGDYQDVWWDENGVAHLAKEH